MNAKSEFLVGNARVVLAERVIERHQTVSLSPADWDMFFDALVNPPEPNEVLKAAVHRFRERRMSATGKTEEMTTMDSKRSGALWSRGLVAVLVGLVDRVAPGAVRPRFRR